MITITQPVPAPSPNTSKILSLSTSSQASSPTGHGLSATSIIEHAEEHWSVSGAAVLFAWAMTFVGSLLIIAVFSWRRRIVLEKSIYQPNVAAIQHRAMRDGPSARDGGDNEKHKLLRPASQIQEDFTWLGWLRLAWRDTLIDVLGGSKGRRQRDEEIMNVIGFDAVVFMQFLRLVRWLFTTLSLVVAIPLVCANYYINTQTAYGSPIIASNADSASNSTASHHKRSPSVIDVAGLEDAVQWMQALPLLTIDNIEAGGLWVHVAFEWIITMIVVFFGWLIGSTGRNRLISVWLHCSSHRELVLSWAKKKQHLVHFKTIMLTELRIKQGTEVRAAEKKVLRILDIEPTQSKIKCRINLTKKDLSHLAEKMDEFLDHQFGRVETILHSWLSWNTAPEDEKAKRSKYDLKPPAVVHLWDKVLCRDAQKSDSYHVQEALNSARQIQALAAESQKDDDLHVEREITSAFVTFDSVGDAIEVLRSFHLAQQAPGNKYKFWQRDQGRPHARAHPISNDIRAQLAPRSESIIWANLSKTKQSLRLHRIFGNIAVIGLHVLNTAPLLAITIFANLDYAIEEVPFLYQLEQSSKIWKAVFTVSSGALPALIGALAHYFLPYLFRWLKRWSGEYTSSDLDKAVIQQLSGFLLISNFIFFSLIGILYEIYLEFQHSKAESWSTIGEKLNDVPAKITEAYISENTYWLSWFPMRALLACLILLQIPRYLLMTMKIFFTMKTHNDTHKYSQPEKFEYAIEYSHIIFAATVALVYTPLAPIVCVCSMILFWNASYVFLNQLVYVEMSKERDGRVWRIVVHRILFATVFMQGLMTITVGLKTKGSFLMLVATLFAFAPVYMVKHFVVDTTPIIAENVSPAEDRPETSGKRDLFEHWLHRPAADWMPDLMVPRDENGKVRTLDDILGDAGEEGRVKSLLKELMVLKRYHPPPASFSKHKRRDRKKREKGAKHRRVLDEDW